MSSAAATQHQYARLIAERLDAEQRAIATRWLDRLLAFVPVDSAHIFPSATLLDHIPELVREMGRFVAAPDEEIADNAFVVVKARELGALRHEQDASIHQLLKEYELLRGILETFVLEETKSLAVAPDADEVIVCLRRLNHAVALVMRTTVDTFVERYTHTISEQTRRLEGFNRLVSHELRQPLGALQTAIGVMAAADGSNDPARRERAMAVLQRSTARLVELLDTITKVSRPSVPADADPGVQKVSLGTVITEAWRELRDAADSHGVDLHVDAGLPDVVVDVGRLELLLTNLLSNAIKYSDPGKPRRSVDVTVDRITESDCVFRVADNGIGMSPDQQAKLFTPFYRGHSERDTELGIEGLGLGLGIARDAALALGASIRVESAAGIGSAFVVTLPLRPRNGSAPHDDPHQA
jgi:signal transduction histidine kinase